MSQRQDKKMRKMFRKTYASTAEMLAKLDREKIFKPKPKWIPVGVWMFLLGFFIKINK